MCHALTDAELGAAELLQDFLIAEYKEKFSKRTVHVFWYDYTKRDIYFLVKMRNTKGELKHKYFYVAREDLVKGIFIEILKRGKRQ